MLIVALAWPVAAFSLGSLAYVGAGSGYRQWGKSDYWMAPNQAVVPASQMRAAQAASFVLTAIVVSLLFAGTMAILLVIWFATKDDRPTP